MRSQLVLILRYTLKGMDSIRDNDSDYLDRHLDERNTYQVHFEKIPVLFPINVEFMQCYQESQNFPELVKTSITAVPIIWIENCNTIETKSNFPHIIWSIWIIQPFQLTRDVIL